MQMVGVFTRTLALLIPLVRCLKAGIKLMPIAINPLHG